MGFAVALPLLIFLEALYIQLIVIISAEELFFQLTRSAVANPAPLIFDLDGKIVKVAFDLEMQPI